MFFGQAKELLLSIVALQTCTTVQYGTKSVTSWYTWYRAWV